MVRDYLRSRLTRRNSDVVQLLCCGGCAAVLVVMVAVVVVIGLTFAGLPFSGELQVMLGLAVVSLLLAAMGTAVIIDSLRRCQVDSLDLQEPLARMVRDLQFFASRVAVLAAPPPRALI
jgi:hypothetical protein